MQVLHQQVRLLLQAGSSRIVSKLEICQMAALMIHGSLNNSSGVTSQSNLPRLKCVDISNQSRSGKPLRLMHEAFNPPSKSCRWILSKQRIIDQLKKGRPQDKAELEKIERCHV